MIPTRMLTLWLQGWHRDAVRMGAGPGGVQHWTLPVVALPPPG